MKHISTERMLKEGKGIEKRQWQTIFARATLKRSLDGEAT
jgi:hypothetical protein